MLMRRTARVATVAFACISMMCIAGCDKQLKPTACVDLSDETRVEFARQKLLEVFTDFAAGESVAEYSDRGKRAYPSEFAGIRGDELELVGRTVEESGHIEFFDFRTARVPGFRWSIALYDQAISLNETCPINFTLRWDGA
jgi:hypothetical protein